MDKSTNKHGAGQHNWGSLQDETHLYDMENDDDVEAEYFSADETGDSSTVDSASSLNEDIKAPTQPAIMKRRASNSITEADRATARSFRTRSFKGRQDSELCLLLHTKCKLTSGWC